MVHSDCLKGLIDVIGEAFKKGHNYQLPAPDIAIKELVILQLISTQKFSKVVFLVDHQKDLSKWSTHFQWMLRNKPWTQDAITFLPYISNYGSDRYMDHRSQWIQRIQCLLKLLDSTKNQIIFTTLTGLLQVTKPRTEIKRDLWSINTGTETEPDQVREKLLGLGFRESSSVEVEGTFSIRGGIIDFFSPLYLHPVRLEIFLDKINSIRFFDRIDQRSINTIESVVLAPSAEFYFSESSRSQLIQKLYTRAIERNVGQAERFDLVESFKRGDFSNELGLFLPFLNGKTESGISYIPDQTLWIFPDGLHRTLVGHHEVLAEFNGAIESDVAKKRPTVELGDHFDLKQIDFFSEIIKGKAIDFSGVKCGVDFVSSNNICDRYFKIIDVTSQKDDSFEGWIEIIAAYKSNHVSVLILAQSSERQDRIISLLKARDIQVEVNLETEVAALTQGSIQIKLGFLSQAVYLEVENVAIIPDYRILGISPKITLSSKRKLKSTFQNFGDLNVRDLVVHQQHGIGRYLGLTKLEIGGQQTEFLIIEYFDHDKIYLPVDRLNVLSRYETAGDNTTDRSLDRLGGSFEARKQKIKLETFEIAQQLLTQQAKRQIAKGYRFSDPDETYFRFESDFPYEETEDQLKVLEEVEQDLKSGRSMDRLVCGDVGFGKTEIALRAAMRAVIEGYQVLVFVPTTVLCYQHFSTFSKRMEKYAVRVEHANRFVPPKQIKKSLEGFASGTVDILIGTHRLLSKDVRPSKLGLLIVDEEQRFGVLHKEKLKVLRENAHILTLSATPIPRTLHMALLGLRDISVIATPPRQRLPIKTVISPFDEEILSKAIKQEIARGGQIFFVHNRVGDIDQFALKIARCCPDARIAVAHGKMPEHRLEAAIRDFLSHKYDVLLCTTIIEAGIDMPNVNTLIVDRADRFGLSQLYQIRGRVGRSHVQAYAYLMIETNKALPEDTRKKLDIIASHQELGAGFLIANRDLELRGAGELLGDAQSGHAQDLGLDFYRDLLLETISDLKGEPKKERYEIEIKIPISFYIPHNFIESEKDRLRVYKNLFNCENAEELGVFYESLKDRYGLPPVEVKVLYRIALLKIYLREIGIESLVTRADGVELRFRNPEGELRAAILRAIDTHPTQFKPIANRGLFVSSQDHDLTGDPVVLIDKIIFLIHRFRSV